LLLLLLLRPLLLLLLLPSPRLPQLAALHSCLHLLLLPDLLPQTAPLQLHLLQALLCQACHITK